MGVEIGDKEMDMDVMNSLLSKYDSLIVALDALGNEDRIFTLDFVKSRLLQEEQRFNMRGVDSFSKPNAALMNHAAKNRSNHVYTYCGHARHSAQRC